MSKREFKNVTRPTADVPIFDDIPRRTETVKVPRRPAPATSSFWELTPPEKAEPTAADLMAEEEKAEIKPLYDNE